MGGKLAGVRTARRGWNERQSEWVSDARPSSTRTFGGECSEVIKDQDIRSNLLRPNNVYLASLSRSNSTLR